MFDLKMKYFKRTKDTTTCKLCHLNQKINKRMGAFIVAPIEISTFQNHSYECSPTIASY